MKELLDVVDKNDNKIGHAPRSHVHSSDMWHRGVHIILLDSEGKIVLQKRSSEKDKFPGRYDFSISGHVKSGENYDETAYKEMYEELGIKSIKLKRLAKLRLKERNDYMISVIYSGRFDGELIRDEDEISSIVSFGSESLKKKLSIHPKKFAKWTREIFKWYFGIPNEIEILDVY